jgi:predicted ATPase
VGKTRLALQLAVTHAHESDRVACIVELAELRPSDDLVAAVATNLRIGEQQEELSEAVLIDALRRQPPVLVLDNCEHVLDSVCPLAEHLAAAVPGITVIATSREPLHVDGEHRFPLGPLAPDDAARLFLDRAAAADPGFAPDDASGAVRSICARLDGLPLAIELAAAALATMDLDQLADGLDHRFQLLSQGRRTASERHRSLRALVAWSFERLTPEQQVVLETLSAVAGSFSAVGAESFVGPSVRWILPELVDRSLVVRERSSSGDRYALLETIRAFAREHLDATTLDDLQRRHTAWVLDLVRGARDGLLGAEEQEWSLRLDADFAELRAAHRYLIEQGRDGDLVELVASLMWWAWAGARSEALGWLEAAVDAGPELDATALVRLEIGGAMAAAQRGAFAEAIQLCERGLARGVEQELPTQAAHHALADVYLLYGDLEASRRHSQQGFDEASARGDRWIRCQSAVSMCLTLTYQGDFEAAARWADLAVSAGEEAEAPTALAWAYYARGEMLADVDPAGASVALERCLELIDTGHASFLHGVCSLTALTVRGRTGDPNDVLTEYPVLIQRWHRVGAWPQLWTTLRTAAELLVRATRFDDAALLLGAIEQRTEAIPTFGADEARYAAVCGETRAALGDRADAAFAAGASLSDDEVVGAALAIVEGKKAG